MAQAKGRLTFKQWIDKIGPKEVGKLLRVEYATVYHWRRGMCLPQTGQMKRIVFFSRGEMSYEQMIDPFHNRKRRKSRKQTQTT